jgi:hypothetical protein
MAILPYLPGLEATVLIEDSPCAEIQCSDDAGEPAQNKVVQYIQSEAGSRFSVKLRVTPQYPHKEYDVVVETYIDGYKVDSTILLRERELGIGLSTGFAFCIRGSRSYTGTEVQLRGFRFANLLISRSFRFCYCTLAHHYEDDRTLNVSDSEVVEKVRDLGDITLKLYRAKEISSGNLLKHAFVFNELSDVPEKALKGKALSQRTV